MIEALFICDKCGLCCKMFSQLKPLLPLEYQALDNGCGECKYLQNNLCSIYKDRPPLCNSDWMYSHVYERKMTRPEYDSILRQKCLEIKEKFGSFAKNGR